MLCSHCGKKIKATADKCPHCGTIFFEEPTDETEDEVQQVDYVLSFGQWLGTVVITFIPLVGYILLLVWSVQKSTNRNLQMYARVCLLIQSMVVILCAGIFFGTDISNQIIARLKENPVTNEYQLPKGWSYVTETNIGTLDSFDLTPMGFSIVKSKLYVFARDINNLYCFETNELKEADYWDMTWCATEPLRLIGRKKDMYVSNGFDIDDIEATELIPAPIDEDAVFFAKDFVLDYQLSEYSLSPIELSEDDIRGRVSNYCRDNKIELSSCIVLGVRTCDAVFIGNSIANAVVPCAVFSMNKDGNLKAVNILVFGYRLTDGSFTNTGSYCKKLTPGELKNNNYLPIVNSYYSNGISIAQYVDEKVNAYAFEEKLNNLLTGKFILPEDYKPILSYVDEAKCKLVDERYGEVMIVLDSTSHLPSDVIYKVEQ